MNFSLHLLRTSFAFVLSFLPAAASAAWHTDGMTGIPGWLKPGNSLPVHYVRLEGTKGNQAMATADRERAVANWRQCVPNALFAPRKASSDEQVVGEFPRFVDYFDVEIYYAGNRTLTVTHQTSYAHDLRTCDIFQTKETRLRFRSVAGICDLSMKNKKASGQCDMQQHANAPPPLVLTGGVKPADPRVPEQNRLVAVTLCRVYLLSVLQPFGEFEVCVANPSSSTVLEPQKVAPEGLHLAVPGVLLEAKGALDLQATQVRWGISVSPSVFSMAPGFAVSGQTNLTR